MKATDARIAIYGAGAMGTVLGVMLKKGGLNNVDLITRNAAHVQGMREHGATIVCEADGIEINEKVNAVLPADMQGEYDVIFLMTKQRYNAETLRVTAGYFYRRIYILRHNGAAEAVQYDNTH